jgi:glycerophosphoryl diester phosphodiesterase
MTAGASRAGSLVGMPLASRAPEVVAHRGASARAPEHTLAAYDLALAQGADALELDVRATADGELVVLHDRTLRRTAGDPRAIAHLTIAGLDGLRRERRPLRLDAVLERYGTATRWLVELKDPAPAWEHRVAATLVAHGLAEHAVLQSFDRAALRRVRRQEPRLAVAPLLLRAGPRRLRAVSRWATAIGVRHQAIDARLVAAAHAHGLAVRAWTVNDACELERLAALGVDGLITDLPDRARAVVAAGADLARAA